MRPCALLRSAALSASLAVGLTGTAQAGAATGGATEWTQLLNNAQLIDLAGTNVEQVAQNAQQIANQITQIQNQLDQYRTMLQNLERLPENIWGDAVGDLNRLQSLVAQGEGIAFSMGGLDDVLAERFGSYAEFRGNLPEDFSSMYETWSQTNRDTIAGTLAGAGLTAEQFQTETQTMTQLQRQSETAVGQMQALQVGHSIAGQQVEQMQKLRGLLSQQTTMLGTWFQSEQAERDLAQARRDAFFGSTAPSTSGGQEMEPRW
ncbi:P-type conjugative transfer protein TrbJ [Brucella intermedia]|uniref:Conjugal transfer protein TrbJ n=1 Tax=Brucella intermedia M86 TaxID=1234597 RepID=M5JT56_9HYPH|nr:P-type conjugative transfer protein TrbJ [Brucella intermedia]ELT46634.1 conjugal transfer protein TrbJ [Brucella intermedia M86]